MTRLKGVLGHFLELFRAHSNPQNLYILAPHGSFRKLFGLIGKNGCRIIVQYHRWDPLGQGYRLLGEGRCPNLMMMHELKNMIMYVQDKIRQPFPIFEHNSSNGKVFKGEFRRERVVEGSTAIPQPPTAIA